MGAIEYTDCFFAEGQDPATSVLDMIWWGSSNAGAFGNVEYPFINIASWSSLARSANNW